MAITVAGRTARFLNIMAHYGIPNLCHKEKIPGEIQAFELLSRFYLLEVPGDCLQNRIIASRASQIEDGYKQGLPPYRNDYRNKLA